MLHVDLGLLAIADRLRQHWTAHAARHGLTSAQVKALLALDEQEPVAMRELAAKLDYDASNLTNVIERLSTRGLIERAEGEHDRRRKSVTLTATGRQTRDAFWTRLTSDPGPLASLTHNNFRALTRLLAKLDLPD